MKRFVGYRRSDDVAQVSVEQTTMGGRPRRVPLGKYLSIINHSPAGHEWGYGGSGPSQLAVAILANVTRDHHLALAAHQDFKRDIIARLPRDASLHDRAGTARLTGRPIEEWCLDEAQVREWVAGWLEDPQNAHDVEEQRRRRGR